MANPVIYSTVVADPPWPTEGGGRLGPHSAPRRPEAQRFPPMTIQAIMELASWSGGKVLKCAGTLYIADHQIADHAHLYLWMVQGHEEDAFKVARDWDFRPICINPWVKGRLRVKNVPEDRSIPGYDAEMVLQTEAEAELVYHWGSGRYWRRVHENYLFCVRGSLMTTNGQSTPSVFLAPRPPSSSWGRKPPEFRAWVEHQSPGPYLELFSRDTPRPGWTMWGNEVGKYGNQTV